jgi:hypothetical protein
LKMLDMQNPETANLTLFDIERILQQVRVVINSAKLRYPLTPDIGPASPVFEAYRLACFALLAVQNNSTPGHTQLVSENSELKQQNAQLKQQNATLISRDATPFVNYVRSEFSISHTDPTQRVKALKRKRARSFSPSKRPSEDQSEIASLTKRVQELEELGRSRELELEHLKASTRTVSTIDFAPTSLEHARLSSAIVSLSSKVARLSSDLADEADQKACLLSLAIFERCPPHRCEPRDASPDSDSDSVSLLRRAPQQCAESESESEWLRRRLSDSAALEAAAHADVSRLEALLAQARADAADARAEQRLLRTKVDAAEEIARRERALAESRSHAADVARDAAREQAVAAAEAGAAARVRAAMAPVAGELAEFVDAECADPAAVVRAAAAARGRAGEGRGARGGGGGDRNRSGGARNTEEGAGRGSGRKDRSEGVVGSVGAENAGPVDGQLRTRERA